MTTSGKCHPKICIYFTKVSSKIIRTEDQTLKEYQHEME